MMRPGGRIGVAVAAALITLVGIAVTVAGAVTLPYMAVLLFQSDEGPVAFATLLMVLFVGVAGTVAALAAVGRRLRRTGASPEDVWWGLAVLCLLWLLAFTAPGGFEVLNVGAYLSAPTLGLVLPGLGAVEFARWRRRRVGTPQSATGAPSSPSLSEPVL